MYDKNTIDFQKYRVIHAQKPQPNVEKMDLMVMSHLNACGMQLNLISAYYVNSGLIKLGEQVGDMAGKVSAICKEFKQ